MHQKKGRDGQRVCTQWGMAHTRTGRALPYQKSPSITFSGHPQSCRAALVETGAHAYTYNMQMAFDSICTFSDWTSTEHEADLFVSLQRQHGIVSGLLMSCH